MIFFLKQFSLSGHYYLNWNLMPCLSFSDNALLIISRELKESIPNEIKPIHKIEKGDFPLPPRKTSYFLICHKSEFQGSEKKRIQTNKKINTPSWNKAKVTGDKPSHYLLAKLLSWPFSPLPDPRASTVRTSEKNCYLKDCG